MAALRHSTDIIREHLRQVARTSVAIAAAAILGISPSQGNDLPFDAADSATWDVPQSDLYDVDLVDDRGYAAGYWGIILRSLDGGLTWNATPTPTQKNLHAIAFADAMHGWAVGAQGAILRTADGGDSWVLQQARVADGLEGDVPVSETFFAVEAISENEVWAVGDLGLIVHSSDSGESWTRVRVPEENFGDDELPDRIFNGVEFSTPTEGWIAGEFGTLLRSRDGGRTWQGERTLEKTANDIYLIGMANATHERSYACGVGGSAVRTEDAGQSWQALPIPTGAGLYDIAASGERVIAVGDRGVIFLSSDSGDTWSEPDSPRLFSWLQGADFGENNRVVVVGEKAAILVSTDGGETFQNSVIESPVAARERTPAIFHEIGAPHEPPKGK